MAMPRCPSVIWACCRPRRSPTSARVSTVSPTTSRPPARPNCHRRWSSPPRPRRRSRPPPPPDAAYGFIYPANLDTLRALGAELAFFSPLAGETLPAACDAVWLPGGYPELHGEALAANAAFWADLRAHVAAGRPVLAECGGLMSLLDTIVDRAGVAHAFGGLLPGRAVMQQRLAALGMQAVELPQGRMSGHTFHYSKTETPLAPWLHAHGTDGSAGEAVYRSGSITASYVHFWFPSNPVAVAALFGAA